MKTAATVLRWLIRGCAIVLLVLGGLFWTGNAFDLIPLHMLVGIVLVLGLWAMAFLGARAGAPPGLVGTALVWGLIVPVFGMTQDGLLTNDLHWLIKVLHLLVGAAAVGMAEALGGRVLRAQGSASRLAAEAR